MIKMIDVKAIERRISNYEHRYQLLELIWSNEGIAQPEIVHRMRVYSGWKQRKTEERLNTLRKLGWIRKDITFDHNRKANTAKCYTLISKNKYKDIHKNTYIS